MEGFNIFLIKKLVLSSIRLPFLSFLQVKNKVYFTITQPVIWNKYHIVFHNSIACVCCIHELPHPDHQYQHQKGIQDFKVPLSMWKSFPEASPITTERNWMYTRMNYFCQCFLLVNSTIKRTDKNICRICIDFQIKGHLKLLSCVYDWQNSYAYYKENFPNTDLFLQVNSKGPLWASQRYLAGLISYCHISFIWPWACVHSVLSAKNELPSPFWIVTISFPKRHLTNSSAPI